MITRKMNERIEVVEITPVKDENGDVTPTEKQIFECWAEVGKATVKEFRDRSENNIEKIDKRKLVRVFYIRHRTDIDTEYLIKWRGALYQITGLEEDFVFKDLLLVSGVLAQ